MKLVAEYLERAQQFDRLAFEVIDDPELKRRLEAQADACFRPECLGMSVS